MNKVNLLDVSFIIPYFKDSPEREENLNCIVKFLQSNFNTRIHIIESGPERTFSLRKIGWGIFNFTWLLSEDGVFHRTKVINHGIKNSHAPFIAIYDTDVVFKPEQIIEAVEKLRAGATLVYPYGGDFIDINRSYIKDGVVIERESFAKESVGGACFLNKEDYWKCGLENEHYQSWCPDDVDRFHRVKTLGYKVERVEGPCWHISHPASPNSGVNKFTQANNAEWLKLKELNKEQLTEYISTWEWAKK